MIYDKEIIRTTKSLQSLYRYYMGKLIGGNPALRMLYLRDLVLYLLSNNEINNLKEKWGEEEYNKLLLSLQQHKKIFEYSAHLDKILEKLSDKSLSDKKIFKEIINNKLKKIASSSSFINDIIIKAFVTLTIKTDLSQLPIRTEQIQHPEKFPFSHSVDEDRRFLDI